ncbi:MAG TPA: DUF3516 domain-containing protein [Acidimicrobiales bacterium]|nr:DUF3516 domain-containing protein [Acidimicrobiales bacterium]
MDAVVTWAGGRGVDLYPAQEEALLEVASGANVVVNTPTGSGKSLVALGAHAVELARGGRSFYTAPIKALVSEKFFDLVRTLGADRVGLVTGDGSVNARAPVVCATAEILANMALRQGADTPVSQVVMDEFHFYADPDRGWAWQVPLIEMTGAQFVLMSATLGDVTELGRRLEARTGRPTAVVRSATRPVPLDYRYVRTPVHRTVEELVSGGLAPVYIVHPTQAAAVERAQALTSAAVATRDQRDAIAEELAGVRFGPGFGRVLSRYLRHGIGVHHAGMLPRYRLLVERLAQQGKLAVICGTDTLGVGINVPIRTVLLTSLSKYDGSGTRLLSAREFHQIAGRAGRAGFDTAGTVVAEAPEHVIDNEQALARAGDDPRKRRKVVRSNPPPGSVNWSEDTFTRLMGAPPEPLRSSFRVSASMLLNVLDRPGDGCSALGRLLTSTDEPRAAQRRHIRRAIAIYRSLVSAGVVQRLDAPDDLGRRVRVTVDLQDDFALNQPLSPFVLEAVPRLDPESPGHALDVLSVVESTIENPAPVLAAQLSRLKTETLARLKEEGVEYEQRMEVLDALEHPKPLGDFLYGLFDSYRLVHPWVDENIRPKSVARDMLELGLGFHDYVAHYGVARSEGLLLRYLTDTYKALVQTVPEAVKTDELDDLTAWLGETVRQVDSSLLDEWERLRAVAEGREVPPPDVDETPPPVTANSRAFRVMVRNHLFRLVSLASRRRWAELAEAAGNGWDGARWAESFAPYYEQHGEIGTGAAARSGLLFQVEEQPGAWTVRQVLDDPAGDHDWVLVAEVDLGVSDERGEPAVTATGFARADVV